MTGEKGSALLNKNLMDIGSAVTAMLVSKDASGTGCR
jgi:hypothetical protein